MVAVVEMRGLEGFGLWGIAERVGFLRLSGEMSAGEVAGVVALLVEYNGVEAREPAAAVRELVEADGLVAPGGLRVRDGRSGAVLVPGCCCGLEDWREWAGLAAGGALWLGHDPDPDIEYTADAVHLWRDGKRADGDRVVIPYERLPQLLEGVRSELTAFLGLVVQWAEQLEAEDGPGPGPRLGGPALVSGPGSGLGPALGAKLDEAFSLTRPFSGPRPEARGGTGG
ncbi:hypothetical protein [Streptomyces iconiensis]|uniref:SUKH-4 immunity protein of toxin-antitoxin system n=1 Tax=Streptomyces iconiensis TaxID=1384038 RepID=A0ABT7A0X6_9ACTN|nr:hypothetical protein [Streptomyces iconiensis]MDJ1134969.1 hypothetical protein [Streptomyces iconiensis]